MKRLIGLILALAVISASGTTALAAEISYQVKFDKQYEIASKIYTADTTHQDIKQSSTGNYALELETPYGTALQPVGRLDVSVEDESSFNELIANEDVPAEIKNAIRAEYERAKEIGNEDLEITYFSPSLLEPASVTGGDETITVVYNGLNMRSDRVYYSNISTGWEYVQTGNKVVELVSTLYSVALIGAGLISAPVIPFVVAGLSLLQLFAQEYTDAVVSGRYDDFVQVRITFDRVDQWTHVQSGDVWYLGLMSECVTVKQIGTYIQLYDSASRTALPNDTVRDVNIYAPTESFESPWATAYQWYHTMTYYESITWKVGSKTFDF